MIRQRTKSRRWRSRITAGVVVVFTLIGFLVILLSLRNERPVQLRPIVVASGEWEPFVGSSLPEGGPVARVMQEVLASAGYEAHFDFMTWAQADQRVAEGSVFGGFPLVLSESRSERMLHSAPIFSAEYVLFTRAAHPNAPTSAADLVQLRVGGVTGYDYWAELDEATDDVIRFDSTAEGFEALLSGEVDVFVEGQAPARVVLADPTVTFDDTHFDIVSSDEPWARSTQDLMFMMPKSSEAERTLERINEALVRFTATAEYKELIESMEGNVWQSDRVVISGETNPAPLFAQEGSALGFTPNGTMGTVQEWPGEYRSGVANADFLVQVKLENGPFAGRILWMDAADVEVVR